ncbi:MAG: hypothetical protein LBP94_03655 [Zoogloeaceae bacterium]|nr:hypothetical protein [Zoogloeaceae bacterium]
MSSSRSAAKVAVFLSQAPPITESGAILPQMPIDQRLQTALWIVPGLACYREPKA